MARSLLGFFQPQPDPLQTLLGQAYDPRQARMSWLGGTLQGLGMGLASGRDGAWAEGLAMGGTEGLDAYRQRALAQYGIQQAQADKAYERSRDAKNDAWNNTVRQRQLEEWQGEQDKEAQADQAWNNLRRMPSTNVSVQNYGMADQLYKMGRTDDALGMVLPPAPQPMQQPDPTNDMRHLMQINQERAARRQPPLGLEDYLASKKGSGITIGPDGTVQIGGAPGKLTEQQSKDVGFYNRMSQVQPLLDSMDTALVDTLSAVGSSIPGIGNFAQSDAYRQATQAGNEFLMALLRKDTGAAVTDGEVALYGTTYLPRAGDDEVTIRQKREARQRAAEGIRMGLGPAEILFRERQIQEQGGGRPVAPGGFDMGADQLPENTPAEGEDGNIYMKRGSKLYRQTQTGWEEVR